MGPFWFVLVCSWIVRVSYGMDFSLVQPPVFQRSLLLANIFCFWELSGGLVVLQFVYAGNSFSLGFS